MTTAIATIGLGKSLGGREVIHDVSLEVPEGSVFGFIGPNGAGKTTTMRLLLGILEPDRGEVKLLGESMPRNRVAALAQVGAFIESPALYDHLSGRANIELRRKLLSLPPAETDRVLDVVAMRGEARRKVRDYSLGMRQRLALARALLGQPRLLILDEPTNGLDPDGIADMRKLIRDIPNRIGATVFVSSHLLAEVEQIATHAGLIRSGHLVAQGALADLLGGNRHLAIACAQPQKAMDILRAHGFAVAARGSESVLISYQPADRSANTVAATVARLLIQADLSLYALVEDTISLEDFYNADSPRAQEPERVA